MKIELINSLNMEGYHIFVVKGQVRYREYVRKLFLCLVPFTAAKTLFLYPCYIYNSDLCLENLMIRKCFLHVRVAPNIELVFSPSPSSFYIYFF